ncbi:hypothetical protein [Roseovarius sp. MMSF_3281]|uniref:hypothetical protein n=1 Tax=Roseovarius sp. MMSF_3281 TaxID=3046694 RepID=UPI00273DDC6A|nr:hypothetical protein [Roseovarius sp. MMSF_3281]
MSDSQQFRQKPDDKSRDLVTETLAACAVARYFGFSATADALARIAYDAYDHEKQFGNKEL